MTLTNATTPVIARGSPQELLHSHWHALLMRTCSSAGRWPAPNSCRAHRLGACRSWPAANVVRGLCSGRRGSTPVGHETLLNIGLMPNADLAKSGARRAAPTSAAKVLTPSQLPLVALVSKQSVANANSPSGLAQVQMRAWAARPK